MSKLSRLVDFFGNLSVPDVFIKNQMFIYFDVLNVPPGHLLGTDFNYFLKVGTYVHTMKIVLIQEYLLEY